ncbi:arginine--tRNA ligase [Alphaproteobacteria bacterium]|nr:arginine--tRNA ligase [Alphaproteobacteria bacterium]GHS97562.1 arginine--tRNA ligase [Alphaproteobacteria bacterium]
MPILKTLQEKVRRLIQDFFLENREDAEGSAPSLAELDLSKVQVDIAREAAHGDVTTNAALLFAKNFRCSPPSLAKRLVAVIGTWPEIAQVDVARAGFINMTLKPHFWLNELQNIVALGENYAKSSPNGQKINIEFVSANPTGPMHTGHVRNAIFGDALAALFEKVGYSVYREYYINDSGNQVECLARSVYLRYKEALGHTLPPGAFQGDIYPGDYLIPVGEALVQKDGERWLQAPESAWLPYFKEFSVQAMMDLIRHDLAELGVVMDCYSSEKAQIEKGKLAEALAILEKNGDIYTGVLTPPKGKAIDDWEARPQTLFRATKYGDEIDRPLKKSDGSWTYFAGDIAYHLDKYQRGFTRLINVLGADHCGYVTRLKAAVQAVTQGRAELNVNLFQIVNFFENGQPVKMSKRAGNFITSQDVVARVGKDATRFMMLTRHHGTVLDFDFEKVLELSQENPVFYVQYAHARICSVFRYAATVFPDLTEERVRALGKTGTTNAQNLSAAEISVLRCLSLWPKVVEQAALHQEPHRIPSFLCQVAGEFHSLWNQGKSDLALRFIDAHNKEATQEKLFLLSGVAAILRDGLKLIGIRPVEEMR